MSARPFEGNLYIPRAPSGTLLRVSALMHAAALAAMFLVNLPAWGVLVGVSAICASALAVYRRPELRAATGEVLLLDARGAWQLLNEAGERIPLILSERPFVHPLLIVLSFRPIANQRLTFLLLQDNADEAVLRRLRVRLGIAPATLSTISEAA